MVSLFCIWILSGKNIISADIVVLTVSGACLIVMLFSVFCFFYFKKIQVGFDISLSFRQSFKVDSQSWMIQSMQAALLNLDVVIAAFILNSNELGSYFIVSRIAALVALPLSVTNPVIIPVISKFAKGEDGINLVRRVKTEYSFKYIRIDGFCFYSRCRFR